jgi:hypothetical protein
MADRHDRAQRAAASAIEAARGRATAARERGDAATKRAQELADGRLHAAHHVDEATRRANRAQADLAEGGAQMTPNRDAQSGLERIEPFARPEKPRLSPEPGFLESG